MIDNLGLAISHGLILLAAWRLLFRPDLDDEKAGGPDASAKTPSFVRRMGKGRPGA